MPCSARTPLRRLTARAGRRGAAALAVAALVALPLTLPLTAPPAHAASVSATAAPSVASSGYFMATSGGLSAAFGTTTQANATTPPVNGAVASLASRPSGDGFWLAGANGDVAAYGGAPYYGSLAGIALNKPVVAMAATADGKGYWMAASDGGIFEFGDARFYGSLGNIHLNQPIVGMASTPDGNGYWLVASDGGIFDFGDARFFGSTGNVALNKPVVGMGATGDGGGYWLVASDGGIFEFGDSRFYGSAGNLQLSAPVVSMASTGDGGGYWLVQSDGGVLPFGDAPFRGSATGTVPTGQSVVGLSPTAGTGTGVMGGGFAAPPAATTYSSGATGYDISWPECGGSYPPSSNVAIVGVNDGYAFSTNPCLRSEAVWGGRALSVYLNINSPQGSYSSQWTSGPAGNCTIGDLSCESYNYGYNTAAASVRTADASGAPTGTYWLDVETTNYWTTDTAANAQVITGAIAAIRSLGRTPAVYATSYQWGIITGGYRPGIPVWYPTGLATLQPGAWCAGGRLVGPRLLHAALPQIGCLGAGERRLLRSRTSPLSPILGHGNGEFPGQSRHPSSHAGVSLSL